MSPIGPLSHDEMQKRRLATLDQRVLEITATHRLVRFGVVDKHSPIFGAVDEARLFLAAKDSVSNVGSSRALEVFDLSTSIYRLDRQRAMSWVQSASSLYDLGSPLVVSVPRDANDITGTAEALYAWSVEFLGTAPPALWIEIFSPERGGGYEWHIGCQTETEPVRKRFELMRETLFPHKIWDGHREALAAWQRISKERAVPLIEDIW